MDADTGLITAAALTTSDVDDASQVGALLDQVDGPVASFTADGAYDQDNVYGQVAARHPKASFIVPPRFSAVPSDTAQLAPTMRDRHLQSIAERGRMAWQKASGYNWRALVEADISRFKRIISDGLRSRTDRRRVTEVMIAVSALNRMLELGRPEYAHIPQQSNEMAQLRPLNDPCNTIAWKAKPRDTRGRAAHYSELTIATALTLQALFRLALRQTGGLIGSVMALLGLDLAVPEHITLSRRAETLQMPRLRRRHHAEPLHLLEDSTGLKLCGAGEWLHEKHGTKTRRDWRTLHFGTDADTGEIWRPR